jgi:hypothetical protein
VRERSIGFDCFFFSVWPQAEKIMFEKIFEKTTSFMPRCCNRMQIVRKARAIVSSVGRFDEFFSPVSTFDDIFKSKSLLPCFICVFT